MAYTLENQVGVYHVSIWKILDDIRREIALLKMAHIEAAKEGKQKEKEKMKSQYQINIRKKGGKLFEWKTLSVT